MFFMPKFIEEYSVSEQLCDDLVTTFEQNRSSGGLGRSGGGVDKSKKDSWDWGVPPDHVREYPAINEYCSMLFGKFLPHYLKKYFKSDTAELVLYEGINLQYYPPEGGYHVWHTEREGGDDPQVYRQLVFMTYLNTVKNAGTEYYYQDWTSTASKGATLLWPADFTFTHRGQISEVDEKYIITGWISFPPQKKRSMTIIA